MSSWQFINQPLLVYQVCHGAYFYYTANIRGTSINHETKSKWIKDKNSIESKPNQKRNEKRQAQFVFNIAIAAKLRI